MVPHADWKSLCLLFPRQRCNEQYGGDLSLDDFIFDIIFCGFDSKQTTTFVLGPPK